MPRDFQSRAPWWRPSGPPAPFGDRPLLFLFWAWLVVIGAVWLGDIAGGGPLSRLVVAAGRFVWGLFRGLITG